MQGIITILFFNNVVHYPFKKIGTTVNQNRPPRSLFSMHPFIENGSQPVPVEARNKYADQTPIFLSQQEQILGVRNNQSSRDYKIISIDYADMGYSKTPGREGTGLFFLSSLTFSNRYLFNSRPPSLRRKILKSGN